MTTQQVIGIPKYAAEDTTLPTKNRAGETVIVPVPAGTPISLHTPGLHYNRKAFVPQCKIQRLICGDYE